jgi:hypothetical protein
LNFGVVAPSLSAPKGRRPEYQTIGRKSSTGTEALPDIDDGFGEFPSDWEEEAVTLLNNSVKLEVSIGEGTKPRSPHPAPI